MDTDIIEIIVPHQKRQKRTPRGAVEDLPNYCECCGFTEGLQTHHIDGNHQNNSRDNRQRLCSRCHDQARKLGEIGFNELCEIVKSNPEYRLSMYKLSEDLYRKKASQGKTDKPNLQLPLQF
jgi:hypothetical protein